VRGTRASYALEPLAPLVQPHPAPRLNQRRLCRHIHALMRQAYQQGEDDIVDHLEDEREGTAVLLSYAIGVRDGLYPEHVEKARRDEASSSPRS
jgi:hypothetical protein